MNFALPGLMNPATPEGDRVPPIKRFLPYTVGTLWEGVTVGPITFFGNPPASPATEAKLRFIGADLMIAQELTASNEDITITDAAAWTFVVAPVVLGDSVTEGLVNWEFLVTSGGVEELIYSGVIVVRPRPETEP